MARVLKKVSSSIRGLTQIPFRCLATSGGIFYRQGFTESGPQDANNVQAIFDIVSEAADKVGVPILTPRYAYHRDNFKLEFPKYSGLQFTPENFWGWRSERLARADCVVAVRLPGQFSESSAVEFGWFVKHLETKGVQDPWKRIHLLIQKGDVVKTTMLRNANMKEYNPDNLEELSLHFEKVFQNLIP